MLGESISRTERDWKLYIHTNNRTFSHETNLKMLRRQNKSRLSTTHLDVIGFGHAGVILVDAVLWRL